QEGHDVTPGQIVYRNPHLRRTPGGTRCGANEVQAQHQGERRRLRPAVVGGGDESIVHVHHATRAAEPGALTGAEVAIVPMRGVEGLFQGERLPDQATEGPELLRLRRGPESHSEILDPLGARGFLEESREPGKGEQRLRILEGPRRQPGALEEAFHGSADPLEKGGGHPRDHGPYERYPDRHSRGSSHKARKGVKSAPSRPDHREARWRGMARCRARTSLWVSRKVLRGVYNQPLPDASLVACAHCDLLQRLPDLPPGASARCPRCDNELWRRQEESRDRTLALTLAAAMLYVVANAVPML